MQDTRWMRGHSTDRESDVADGSPTPRKNRRDDQEIFRWLTDGADAVAVGHQEIGEEEVTELEDGPSPDEPNAGEKSKDETTIADIDLAALR